MWVILTLCGLVAGCDHNPERIYSPWIAGDLSHPPAVRILAPTDGAQFHAHENIRLLVLATPYGTDLGPDEEVSKHYADPGKWNFLQDPEYPYSVEFLAGTNSLGLTTSGAVSASMRSQHGEAIPMIAIMAGYPAVSMVWPDAPVGTHALTVRVTNKTGLTTVSAPVNITVLP